MIAVCSATGELILDNLLSWKVEGTLRANLENPPEALFAIRYLQEVYFVGGHMLANNQFPRYSYYSLRSKDHGAIRMESTNAGYFEAGNVILEAAFDGMGTSEDLTRSLQAPTNMFGQQP